MLSHVGIICFAASYSIVLAMEVSRLLFRSGIRGAFMIAWAGAGLLAHSIYIYYNAVTADGVPLSSWQDWFFVAAWVLMVVYLCLLFFRPRSSIGIFLLPLVLGLIVTGVLGASDEPFAREPASKVWGAIHGASLAGAIVSILVAFAAGVMYIEQMRRLKHKRPIGQGLRLPSLEWLERVNQRAIIVGLILLVIGVLGGMVLNMINHRSQDNHLPWSDPIVLSTLVLFICLLTSIVVSHVYVPIRQRRKVVFLTIVCFVFLVTASSIGLILNTQHGGTKAEPGTAGGRQELLNGKK